MPATETAEEGAGGSAAPGFLRRLGEWCARHFVVVIIAWLVAVVALQVVSRAVGGTYEDNFQLPGVQSTDGLDVLKEHDPQAGGYSSQIVLHDDQQSVSALSSQLSTTVGDLQKLPMCSRPRTRSP